MEFEKNLLFDLILREKPSMALLYLKDSTISWYSSLLAKKVDCTYPHIIKIISMFQELDLVKFERRGRRKVITLTDRGVEVSQNLEGLVRTLMPLDKGK